MSASSSSPPREWVEPETGYRVFRLSEVDGSSSLYFNFNGYTPEGDYLVISTPNGLSKVGIKDPTLPLSEIVPLDRPFNFLFTGRETRTAYYELLRDASRDEGGKTIMAVDVDTGVTRKIAEVTSGSIQSINADETLLGGVEADPAVRPDAQEAFAKRDPRYDQANYQARHPDGRPMTYHEAKGYHMIRRFEARIPMKLFVIDTRTGERRDVYEARDWLNHLLFSPTDPNVLLFCHEGPWHRLDRLWVIRVDLPLGQAQPTCIHKRTMNMEIAGHEWWSRDGRTVWYDLQLPKGKDFFVAGYEVATGKRTWYHLERDEWSVHFHSSNDDKLFAGDGGAENMVAKAKDGRWLYLFDLRMVEDDADGTRVDDPNLIQGGWLASRKLVNMKSQDYRLEPNVNFTPDGRYLVFRANFHGGVQTYAVDLASTAD
ncbi:hypothetical protein JCM24511_09501 [Saitozyma sp. JCM 24511]|nr:hypothetical protein JCM24511_09501 [Saitozyma sp. JCM 24511]